ncbi:DUF1304 domain-containing protein [Glutamicibacter arilaitensis]|uniref:DUF1304 domain-containing protein n=1 Tax=Glutamicibacter arilaitensis TaxID=256701 RepID=A0A2N7S4G9_9MICC|nr:DUF1304 domain-containing protein [Glutamicibacter arilaitensis]PMQ21033.1 DUF1304 domain-containing protein [Glutamicibacter arilaitensis]
MIIAALIAASIAALLHVYIFSMESLTWTSKRTRAVFNATEEEAEATREMAFNQGFYNLFLALASLIGVLLVALGNLAIGATLIFAGTGSMLAAALVLAAGSPRKAALAVRQGLFPLLAVVLLGLGVAMGR